MKELSTPVSLKVGHGIGGPLHCVTTPHNSTASNSNTVITSRRELQNMKSNIGQSKKRPRSDSHDLGPSDHTTKDEKNLLLAFDKFGKALCKLLSTASGVPNTQRCIGGEKEAFLRVLKTRVDGGGFSWVGKFDDGKKYRFLGDDEREGQEVRKKVKLMVQLQAEIRGRNGSLSEEGEEGPSENWAEEDDETSSVSTHDGSSQIEWPPLLPSITDRNLCTQVFCTKNTQGPSPDHKRLSWLGGSWIHLLMSRIIFRNKNLEEVQLGRLRHCLLTDKAFANFAVRYGLMEEFKIQNEIRNTPGTKEMADIFRAYVATVAFSNPHGGFEVMTSWLEKLYQPILLSMEDEVWKDGTNAYLSEKLQNYLKFRPNTQFSAGNIRRQPEKEAKQAIMAAEIGFRASTQAKMVYYEMIERERVEEAAQAAPLKSEALTLALAKEQSGKIERETVEEAAQVTKTGQTKSGFFTQERARHEKGEGKKKEKNAVEAAQLELEALAKERSGKTEREQAEAKIAQLVPEALVKFESEKIETEKAENTEKASRLEREVSAKAKSEKNEREVENAITIVQLKADAMVLAKARSKKTDKEMIEIAAKTAQRKAVALALAGAESEEMEKKQSMAALSNAKKAEGKQRVFQLRCRVAQQAVKETIELDYGSPPLQPLPHQSGNIRLGQDKANPIIILDSEGENREGRESKVVKELKALEQIVVNNIKAAPLPFSAKKALDRLVNEIEGKLIYSRLEDRHAAERRDTDNRSAGRKAAEALLVDQHFLQELARMRLATKEDSGNSTTLLGANTTSAAAVLPSLGPCSLPSLVACVNRGNIPVVPSSNAPHTAAIPVSKLAQAPTKKADILNSENLAAQSMGGNMNSRLKNTTGWKEILRVVDPISRVPQEESSSVSANTQSEGIIGDIGTVPVLPQEGSCLDMETLVVEDEILDDAHPSLRASKEELSSRLIAQQAKVRAPVQAYYAACRPQEKLSLGAGTTWIEDEVSGTTRPAANLPQGDSSSTLPALQVAERAGVKRNPTTYLLEEDTSPNKEDIVVEYEILNHADPFFKATKR
ncbi:hypothetical protein P167DRAFT_565046 [Morchella conica CCBAS932]|uniref:RNase III domain-containing protein n=1 Tax=Morchella conica CCBAS932 TaxID=1392247 RepID=A0A3N4KPZ1_9PEZI|nr:hypothetical protein P167DRAFT_565046 [Morchella conica CCBAS932]